MLEYPRGFCVVLFRWLCDPYVQLWGSLGLVQNASQTCLIIICVPILLCLMLGIHLFLKLRWQFSNSFLVGKRWIGKYLLVQRELLCEVLVLCASTSATATEFVGRQQLVFSGLWFDNVLSERLSCLFPGTTWSISLYCRMKCLIQFWINLGFPSHCNAG